MTSILLLKVSWSSTECSLQINAEIEAELREETGYQHKST